MSLVECKECKQQISDSAEACPHCGKKIPAKSNIGQMIGAIVVGTVIVVWIGIKASDGTTAPAPNTAEAVRAPVANARPYETTPSQLFHEYETNEVATNERIGESPIRIVGTLSAIDEDMFKHPELRFDVGDEFHHVSASLEPEYYHAAAGLRKGQKVVVLCAKVIRIVDFPTASECRLID